MTFEQALLIDWLAKNGGLETAEDLKLAQEARWDIEAVAMTALRELRKEKPDAD